MDREIPFMEDEYCDNCHELGCYDFMGDCLCRNCMDIIYNTKFLKFNLKQKVKMKLILSYILYAIGHLLSKFIFEDDVAILYPLYSWLMGKSCNLDTEYKLWKKVEEIVND